MDRDVQQIRKELQNPEEQRTYYSWVKYADQANIRKKIHQAFDHLENVYQLLGYRVKYAGVSSTDHHNKWSTNRRSKDQSNKSVKIFFSNAGIRTQASCIKS